MTDQDLQSLLQRIDGRPYPAYKDILGSYDFATFTLSVDRVQGDPFAAPSRLSLSLPHASSGLSETHFSNASRRVGTENFLALSFAQGCREASGHLGSGKSGLIAIDTPGQELLARTCVEVGPESTVFRFSVGLPANGRRIKGRAAAELLTQRLPQLVKQRLLLANLDQPELQSFADTAEDADSLRLKLEELGLIAFVANGAILPRASGIDPRPMSDAVPFQSPPSLQVSVDLPHAGSVSGMGIPKGVTLIVGGGYHGKSTLLAALERGVYNHRPGDGRERVVACGDATKVRAEDGRYVAGVDLSPFIGHLPGSKDASAFTTENASGSSSQAASIIEALETGAKTLLIDEDISATNLLIRDARMQRLIAPDKEPITPFVQRVRSLFEDCGVSTVIVLGGSGDYFEPADRVIALDNYLPRDLTAEAKALCDDPEQGPAKLPISRENLALEPSESKRFAESASLDPYLQKGGRPGRLMVKSRDARSLTFGNDEIDLSLVPQLIDASQTRAVGAALVHTWQAGHFDSQPLPEALQKTIALAKSDGLSRLGTGDLAEIRLQELAAALNRLRCLKIR